MSEEITPYQVVPKTPLAGSAAAEIREQGEITRRSFPLVITAAWLSLTAALGGLASVLGRFMFPNVLFEPVQKFKAGFVNDYAVGEVDEATSALGLARASVAEPRLQAAIHEAQRDLYVLMAELASPPEVAARLSRRIGEADVRRLEELEEQLLGEVEIAPEFIMPGHTLVGATLDFARTVVRRTERRVARLAHDRLVENPEVLRYVNRLSDLLFVMARYVESGANGTADERR